MIGLQLLKTKIKYKMKGIVKLIVILLVPLFLAECEPLGNCEREKDEIKAELEETNKQLQNCRDSFADSINWIDSIRWVIKDSTIFNRKDSTIFNFKDSIVFVRDTLPTYYLDSMPFYHTDTIIDTTVVSITAYKKDSSIMRFYYEKDIDANYKLGTSVSWFQYGLNIRMDGWDKLWNNSSREMDSDTSVYMEIIIYDSTFVNELYTDKIFIPKIVPSTMYKLEWNSGDWVFPYLGEFYISKIIYVIDPKKDRPVDGIYHVFKVAK